MKQRLLVTISTAALLAASIQPALADAETDALRAQLKTMQVQMAAMQKKLSALEKKQMQPPVTSKAAADKILAQRVAAIEEKQAQEPTTTFTPGKGLTVTSPDKQYALRASGYLQVDNRTFFSNGGSGPTNTFLLRSARPTLEAKLTDYFDTRFQADFGKGQTTLLDAYGDFHPMPGSDLINLRAGEFKVPVGLERWQKETEVLFVERSQTVNLVPYRDIGVMAHGDLIPGQLEYELGVTNGAADLQVNTADADNNKDVVGRVFVHPLAKSNIQSLQGIGLGVAGTYGVHQGSTSASGLSTGYVSFGQRAYFTYKSGTFADGPQWRLNPQATYYNGPLGLLGEYVLNEQQVDNGGNVTRLRNDAWMGTASYVLTGEDARFDGVVPSHDFDPRSNHWGAFELAGRISQLHVDRSAFGTYADPTVSAREAFEATLGANWYVSRAVKFNLDFSRTTFDGGYAGGADRPDEKAVLTRMQLKF